jgi:predicted Zn-dependent peptidase
MLFKGTSKKSALDIVKFIEGLGGSFDAYTTKENLIIVTKFLSEHITRVFNLISELLLESKLAADDFKKEKSVIIEEIKSNDEDPAEYVIDLFFKALYPQHSIGLPIAGTQESVCRIDLDCTRTHYHQLLKKEIVIAISGNYDFNSVARHAKQAFSQLSIDKVKRTAPEPCCGRISVQTKSEISQVHVVFGLPGIPYRSNERYQFSILNTAFGGGMSSRLFQGLREKKGLVYNVHSFVDMYSDCGISGFYFVCDKANLKRVAAELKSIFKDIKKNGFKKDEIELAKTYLSGNLLLSLESSTNRMLRFGREMCYLNRVMPINTLIKKIRSVTASSINKMRGKYCSAPRYTVAAVGPVTKKEITDFVESIVQ